MVHNKPLVSVVIPVYNESDNLQKLYVKLQSVFSQHLSHYRYELIFIDDGSHDNSWHIVSTLAQKNSHICCIKLSRNFGHQVALSAGYQQATGDAIISMDADLQDPPALIPQMINAWRNGAKIVYARRIIRNEGYAKQLTARFYYALLNYVANVHMPRNVGDFRLIDKQVLEVINCCPERARYLRGMIAWTGFPHAFVEFSRPNRNGGVTGYSWQKMFTLAFDGLTSFSLFPLKIAAYIGTLVIITGTLMFVYITCDTIFFDKQYPLFKWLVTIIYIFMGVQFLLLWLLGEYIGRIHEQIKERPLFIIEKKI